MKIAVAIGDPNGIGPEIAVKAARRFIDSPVQPILVGDEQVLRHYGAEGKLHPVKSLEPEAFKPGTLDPRAGRATVEYIRAAVGMVRRGEADAIVACPQSETAINKAGIPFSGYAGLLAELTNTPKERTFLMLVAAVRRLGVANPSLGVFGINPHAGEDGLFGDEDERITKPAVAELRKRGIDAHGPAGADLLLSQRRHDVYLAMFHDQGHIPIKLVSPLRSSALSIGTPVLFSSVGHGCAYDIAGKNVADPASVIETLSLLGGTAP